MAGSIPPTGSSPEPQPTGGSIQQKAQALSNNIGNFVDSGFQLLRDPARADDPTFLSQFAQLIKTLHQQCQEVKQR